MDLLLDTGPKGALWLMQAALPTSLSSIAAAS